MPDHSNRFRNKLIQRKLEEKLLAEVNRQLEKLELKVERAEAAITDATVIESGARPRRTKKNFAKLFLENRFLY